MLHVVCSWFGDDVMFAAFHWPSWAGGFGCECVCVRLVLWFAVVVMLVVTTLLLIARM